MKPIVFIGPSLPLADASRLIDAEFRLPARRGDFETIEPGRVVGLIDGVFDQDLAVSPAELRDAVKRGVRVWGSSSMGALRANEVPGITGVGRVFDMYRRGEIEDDDEVALSFDVSSGTALSVPMVNVRHAVDRLVRPGTITADVGAKVISAAKQLWYPDRIYPTILKRSGLWARADGRALGELLAQHDLKRDDAVTLLEQLRTVRSHVVGSKPRVEKRAAVVTTGDIHAWEFGAPVSFERVVEFLKLTGAFPALARQAWSDSAKRVRPAAVRAARIDVAQRLRTVWHWVTDEEVEVSLGQLGFDGERVSSAIAERANELAALSFRARRATKRDLERLRAALFLEDVALKRATARLVSLESLAASGRTSGALSDLERAAAVDRFCACADAADEAGAIEKLSTWGVSEAACRQFIESLAYARRAVLVSKVAKVRSSLKLPATPKLPGDARFCVPTTKALKHTTRLAPVIGVTRVAMITGLGPLGLPNAQAFRPSSVWSSTVGSGKSETPNGAKVGAVMEELEKWAQERYAPPAIEASFDALVRERRSVIDPATLDLPWDTTYQPDRVMRWVEVDDLISGKRQLVPAAAVVFAREADDVYYSPHAGRKVTSTNGLASAFTLSEALTHAISEYVERHALISSTVLEANPGAPWVQPSPLIDLSTLPESSKRLVQAIESAGHQVRVCSLSAIIGVPTFHATILTPVGGALSYQEAWKEQLGHASHPVPEVALRGALLEAAQGMMSDIAGAREDITLHARSLGRHERSKVRSWSSYLRARAPFQMSVPFSSVKGFHAKDARDDVRWLTKRVAEAGFKHLLVANVTHAALAPAHVVRVIIPGMDTVNPFFTGPRTRAGLLADLLG